MSLGHIYCPRCGSGPYAVMRGWRLRPHGPRTSCHGPDADTVLWAAMGLPIRNGRPWVERPWWSDREHTR
ncbi:MAG: hypothetical protein H0T66_10755 [Geodermatophilaceae bacterium]|nr:hypothetical protein [Geodermatophilaceae bacterium]